MPNVYAYARVSTTDQNLDGQRAVLMAAGAGVVFEERVSGKAMDGRTQLALLLELVGAGDVIIVHRLDRLARNVSDVIQIVERLKERKATLRVLEPAIDIGDDITSRVLLLTLGMTSELERSFMRERQSAGISRRREMDKSVPVAERAYRGRRRTIDRDRIRSMVEEGIPVTSVAKALNISRMSVYRCLRQEPEPGFSINEPCALS